MLPPNPDPVNIVATPSGGFAVHPCLSDPPAGRITAFQSGRYAPNQGFSINDGTHDPIAFFINTAGNPQPGPGEIDISQATSIAKVGKAIADAINRARASGLLFVEASADPASGTVYLTYDFTLDLASDGRSVVITDMDRAPNDRMPAGSLHPWQADGPRNDIRNIQWAIESADDAQTVLLKKHPATTNSLAAFRFGKIGRVSVTHDLSLEGEPQAVAGFNQTQSGGWVLAGTTIQGGTQMVVGEKAPVTYSIRHIIFDGFRAGAIRVRRSKGESRIAGCHFRDFVAGRTVGSGTIVGAFPIVVHGGEQPGEADTCGGQLKVLHNYFGAPVDHGINNLMHFSNCDLDLEIRGNEIDGCEWAGFVIFGNKKLSTIARNTIRKTGTYLDGAAIAVGAVTANFFSDNVRSGPSVIKNNHITVKSPNSSAIVVAAYPRDLPDQAELNGHPAWHTIENNEIEMEGGKAALACRGLCAHANWKGNVVSGWASIGIWVTRSVPPAPFQELPVAVAGRPTLNVFDENSLRAFSASLAEVFLENADGNVFRDNDYGAPLVQGGVHGGLAGAYIKDSTDNTLERETFWGDYPGLKDTDPLPCVWIAANSGKNTVRLPRLNGLALEVDHMDSDLCTEVLCSTLDGNTISGSRAKQNAPQGNDYATCPVVVPAVVSAMATKEQSASTAIDALHGN